MSAGHTELEELAREIEARNRLEAVFHAAQLVLCLHRERDAVRLVTALSILADSVAAVPANEYGCPHHT